MSHARSLRLFLSGYALLIALGTILLSLPGAAASSDFFTTFFTATSAVCLVGLTLVDTATHFTPLGQAILLLLIQLGALFYLFFAVQLVRQMNPASPREDTSPGKLFRRIVLITLLVEIGIFPVIFYAWGDYPFEGIGHKTFITAFHAVSAFCNAGFSVLDENLYTVQRAFVLHLVVLVAYGLGGLGIDPLYDLFSPKRLRQRLAKPETDWRPTTKIAVNMSILLVGVGAALVYGLEQNNTLEELNLTEKLIASVFQSATTRTAGFYAVDITQLTTLTLLVMTVLMFIGGGAGSTAGGIKTTTFYAGLTFWQKYSPAQAGRTPRALARWIVGYALSVNVIGTLALHLTEPDQTTIPLLFEQVSAFSSVGLSSIATGTMSGAGQMIILLSMLLGRIGILALMMLRLSGGMPPFATDHHPNHSLRSSEG